MSVMYHESNSIFYFVNTIWPYFFPLPFKPAPSLHLCVCTPHRHTKRCTKLVSDARAGRSSWQMLHSGSLGVMHGTHVLITCCASLDSQSAEWQSSRLPHVCLPTRTHMQSCQPASFFFSTLVSFCCFASAVHSWFMVGFLQFVVIQFHCFHQSATPPEIFNVCLTNVGQAQVCTPKFIFWLSPCENIVCVRMEA